MPAGEGKRRRLAGRTCPSPYRFSCLNSPDGAPWKRGADGMAERREGEDRPAPCDLPFGQGFGDAIGCVLGVVGLVLGGELGKAVYFQSVVRFLHFCELFC
jgi:hypothetical protein